MEHEVPRAPSPAARPSRLGPLRLPSLLALVLLLPLWVPLRPGGLGTTRSAPIDEAVALRLIAGSPRYLESNPPGLLVVLSGSDVAAAPDGIPVRIEVTDDTDYPITTGHAVLGPSAAAPGTASVWLDLGALTIDLERWNCSTVLRFRATTLPPNDRTVTSPELVLPISRVDLHR